MKDDNMPPRVGSAFWFEEKRKPQSIILAAWQSSLTTLSGRLGEASQLIAKSKKTQLGKPLTKMIHDIYQALADIIQFGPFFMTSEYYIPNAILFNISQHEKNHTLESEIQHLARQVFFLEDILHGALEENNIEAIQKGISAIQDNKPLPEKMAFAPPIYGWLKKTTKPSEVIITLWTNAIKQILEAKGKDFPQKIAETLYSGPRVGKNMTVAPPIDISAPNFLDKTIESFLGALHYIDNLVKTGHQKRNASATSSLKELFINYLVADEYLRQTPFIQTLEREWRLLFVAPNIFD